MAYEVRHVSGVLDAANLALLEFGSTDRRVAIIDGGLPRTWNDSFRAYFAARDVELHAIEIPGSETSKSWETLGTILHFLARVEVARREDPVLIIGGGAVLDVGGLAASLFRRGVPYIRIPTTLLAYVDAAVGIKTAINFDGMKNIVGSFAPPTNVLLDDCFHRTQSAHEIECGLGEVFKLAVGCDAPLFTTLRSVLDEDRPQLHPSWSAMLDQAIASMMNQLEPDPWERELERAVDLGHTFSLALETAPLDPLSHGHAVTVDVMITAHLATLRGGMTVEDRSSVCDLGARLLPSGKIRLSVDDLWSAVHERRLHRGLRQRMPVPTSIGACHFVNDVSRQELVRACEMLAEALPGNFWVQSS